MSVQVAERPISVEQIATTIEQMNLDEQRRLLDLAPSLLQLVYQAQSRTLDQAKINVARLQKRLQMNSGKRAFSPNDPFLGGLTWAQYDALNDEEKEMLWEQAEAIDLLSMKEREVSPNALFA